MEHFESWSSSNVPIFSSISLNQCGQPDWALPSLTVHLSLNNLTELSYELDQEFNWIVPTTSSIYPKLHNYVELRYLDVIVRSLKISVNTKQNLEFVEHADLEVSIILSIPCLLPGYTIYRTSVGGREGGQKLSKKVIWTSSYPETLLTTEKPFVVNGIPRLIPFIKKILLLTFGRKENILNRT